MLRFMRSKLAVGLAVLVLAGCSQAAATPTAAPKSGGETPKPAAPAASPAAASSPGAAASPSAAASPGAAAAAASPATAAAAPKPTFNEQAVADFYRGKTVRVIVGFAPGGGYDTFARLVAKHVGKFLPGSPTVIVENRPGGASLIAANSVYTSEPKDGTVLTTFGETAILQQAMGVEGIQFDAKKFNWIGAPTKSTGICFARKDSGVTSVEQLLASNKELPTVAVGKGTLDYSLPAAVNGVLAPRFKLVTGYAGSGEAQAAWEKGEGDVFCGGADNLLTRQRRLVEGPDALGKVLFHSGLKTPELNDPIMQGVPSLLDLAKDEQGKQLIMALNVTLEILRPLAMAPEVPRDRVEAWRAAVAAAYRDAEFAADAKQAYPLFSVEITSTGAEVENIVDQLFALPKPVLDRMKELIS